MKLEVEFIRVCPYCGKMAKNKRKTCGRPLCQYKHHLKSVRDYWNKYHRKTNRVNKAHPKP
ncbi:MAG: hypothetical protein KJ718_00835 [Nanoarchaeota archaeon]|nr:hypothetical protein [Nanoarchaeota archaeon]